MENTKQNVSREEIANTAARLAGPKRSETQAWLDFNQSLVDDPLVGYIYESPAASRIALSVRYLFNAIFNRYSAHPAEGIEAKITQTSDDLSKLLRYSGVCNNLQDAKDVTADIMSRAKCAITQPKPDLSAKAKRRWDHEAEDLRRLRKKQDADGIVTPSDDQLQATRFVDDYVRSKADAAKYHGRKAEALQETIEKSRHISEARLELYRCVKDESYDVEQAISVTADILRGLYDSDVEFDRNIGNKEIAHLLAPPKKDPRADQKVDLMALFATRYQPLLEGVPETIISKAKRAEFAESIFESLKKNRGISSAAAVVLLDAQRQAALEASIEISGAVAKKEISLSDPRYKEQATQILGKYLNPVYEFIKQVRGKELLADKEFELLQDHALRIKMMTFEFLQQSATRRER